AQQYLIESHSTCILRHANFDVRLETNPPVAVVHLEPEKWFSLEHSADFERKRAELEENRVEYNEWILRLTLAIEKTHCESFIVFQEHIPKFAHYFYNASSYAIWRSTRNRFIFVYTDELLPASFDAANYFDGYIFHDQPNIWLISAPFLNATVFEIKSNQFVGPRYFGKEPMPVNFDALQLYDAQFGEVTWDSGINLSSKLRNLQGREIIVGIFNYKPFMLLDYDKQPKIYNRAQHGADVHIDGTEVRLLLSFCELHNCTLQADTTELTEWGDIYPNYTGTGLMGMVLDRTTDYGIGGLYVWYEAYIRMEITQFLGRSGATCLVPAPHPMINWALPLRPFQATLWLCVLACLMLECISLAVTRQCERTSAQSWQQSLRFGYVSTLKLFVNQSTSYVTTSYALRTVLLASYMIDIILTTVYGGGLAAILTLPKLEEAADSRQRLYEHKLPWSATSYAWINIFDTGTVDVNRNYCIYVFIIKIIDSICLQSVLLRLMERFRVYDADDIAIKSRTEQMGFVVERMQFGHLGNAEIIPDDALSRLKLMVDDIYFAYTVAYVPRLWAHLEAHNQFTLAWHSSGFDKYWEWQIAADYMNANRQNRMTASQIPKLDIGPVKLGIDNFIGLILLWCFGLSCSLLVFVVELWWNTV
ncbi:hypothetical protein KR093_009388, partial [Drosophila rubida]